MKSLIVFVDFNQNTEVILDRVRRYMNMGDTVFFAHELQSIDDSLVPMIGDLTEIRKRKIRTQLSTLFNGLGALTPYFNPIVFEDQLDLSDYLDALNASSEILILDNTKYVFQFEKKRFSKWIDEVRQPIKAVSLTDEVITVKN